MSSNNAFTLPSATRKAYATFEGDITVWPLKRIRGHRERSPSRASGRETPRNPPLVHQYQVHTVPQHRLPRLAQLVYLSVLKGLL